MLRQDILENKWKENDKFFSVRQISIKYEVNLNTVLKVIRMLEEKGYLYSIKGKGCFVKKGYNLDIGKRMTPILNTFRFGQNSKNMEINFSNGGPPKEYFPIDEYKEIPAAEADRRRSDRTPGHFEGSRRLRPDQQHRVHPRRPGYQRRRRLERLRRRFRSGPAPTIPRSLSGHFRPAIRGMKA